MARRYDSADSKRRIISACVSLFIEKGYTETRMTDILKTADVSSGTFQNIFHTKDGVLGEFIEFTFAAQFNAANKIVAANGGNTENPAVYYATETALQLALTEINENLRSVYIEAYTQQESAELIYQKTASELYRLFNKYMPGLTSSEFYEREIGTSSLMRGYMSRPCDVYFTLEKKIQVFADIALSAYNVPAEAKAEAMAFVRGLDMTKVAREFSHELFHLMSIRYEFTLSEKLKNL